MVDHQRPVWLYKFELSPGKWVFAPDEATKQYGRELVKRIRKEWKPPRYYVHLSPQGHVRALRTHLGNSYFARVDIKRFYNSIRKSRVTRHLTELFRDYQEARAASVMSTVQNPVADDPKFVLPFGFVQSPILAALCLYQSKLGSALKKLPRNIKRCVYVDDILLSTSHSRGELVTAYEAICEALIASRFQLHEEKIAEPSEAIQVFNLDIANRSLEVSKERLKEFELALAAAESRHVVDGILGYVRSVNPGQAQGLQDKLEAH